MIEALKTDASSRMQSALEALQVELGKMRTGRASLSMLDSIKVDYYGAPTPLNQVATLATPEARLITIQPWEANIIPEIEKSILTANIGLTPTNDGKIVRLPVPALTEERRKDIVKQIKARGEDCRVSIRQARKDANDELKRLEKAKEISEDDAKRGFDEVQKVTDDFTKKTDEVVAAKEKDIMTV